MIGADTELTVPDTSAGDAALLLRTMPAQGLGAVVELARARGVETARIMAAAGVSTQRLAGRITVAEEMAVLGRLLGEVDDVELGVRAADCYSLDLLGPLGAVVQSADTAGEAVRIFLRYLGLSFTHFHVSLEDREDVVALEFRSAVSLGCLYRYYLLRDIAFALNTFREVAPALTRQGLAGVDLVFDPPANAGWLEGQLDCPVRYSRPCSAVRLHRGALEQPLPHANALIRRELEAQCRRELADMEAGSGLLGAVRRLLATSPGRTPGETQLAEFLAMTPRTLRRHMARTGTRFRHLVNQARSQRARELLETTRLPVSAIAEQLGYAEAAPFIRAFRRWTGTTPARYRKQMQSASGIV